MEVGKQYVMCANAVDSESDSVISQPRNLQTGKEGTADRETWSRADINFTSDLELSESEQWLENNPDWNEPDNLENECADGCKACEIGVKAIEEEGENSEADTTDLESAEHFILESTNGKKDSDIQMTVIQWSDANDSVNYKSDASEGSDIEQNGHKKISPMR